MTRQGSIGRMAPNPRRGTSWCARLLRSVGPFCLLLVAHEAFCQQTRQDTKPTEYEVEAAYLSNFGRFIESSQRPVTTGDSFGICVYGQDPFGSLLDAALKGESIGGAPMMARRITALDEIPGCRILFISQSKENQLPVILDSLRHAGVLTVSDIAGFTRRGGMIEFVLEGNRVRFEINVAAAQRAGLALSSQLLKLAVTVRRTP